MDNPTTPSEQNASAVVKFNAPWSVVSKFVGPLHIQDASGNTIAHVGHEDFRTCCAIAEVIAAAPVMLAALYDAESAMTSHNLSRKHEGHECPWDFAEGFGGTLDNVRAAIAKATGAA